MKQIFTNFMNNNGWNYVATLLVVLAGWYWLGLCDNGAFFQLTGFILCATAAGIWATKTEWAKKFWKIMNEDAK